MKPAICLGTAQFGQAYGITNAAGQVPEEKVGKLLAEAKKQALVGWTLHRPMAMPKRC